MLNRYIYILNKRYKIRMIYKTYLDKVTTIIKNSDLNTGINPVAELHYGDGLYSRMLVHFDHTRIKEMIEDKTFGNEEKVKHFLHLTNAGSIDFTEVHCGKLSDISFNRVQRAASFDLIFFFIPQEWDGGKGFDMIKTKYSVKHGTYAKNIDTKLVSTDGCNWFQPRNGYKWKEEGVYSNTTLSQEYEAFGSTEGSPIVFARQHFDIGNEDICVDITDVVNKYVKGELENYGIGIAFSPLLEESKLHVEKYASFLSKYTNTFFEPYVMTVYDDYICDDRGSFTLNKMNRLYLYCNVGGHLTNLDELPKCTINDIEYVVKQHTKGIYYAEVLGDKSVFNTRQMYYDIWSNIKIDGIEFDDVEMDFVVNTTNSLFNFGNTIDENIKFTASIYGINDLEKIRRGDIRKITLINRQNYSTNKCNVIDEAYFRLYVKDGTRDYDIIGWCPVNKTVKENFFTIDTNMLIPERYYIDVKYKYNMEEITQYEVIKFDIIDQLNNKFN